MSSDPLDNKSAQSEPSLASCPVFQGLTTEELAHVLSLLDEESYAKGAIILHEGKSKQALWLVARGTCQVVKKNKSGNERELATLEAHAVFGEMSFFRIAPHSATVRASSNVVVSRLTREKYQQLYSRCPSAAYKITESLVSLLAQRLRRMDEWICSFVERSEGADHQEEWHDFREKLYADWQF
jgi:CRP-like cAMP-binding protein